MSIRVYAAVCADNRGVTTLTVGQWDSLERIERGALGQSRALWIFALACIASALLGRLCYLFRPFDADAAMFVYMGKLTNAGGRLCHELIDNKFPTVGLMTSVPWQLFGANWAGYVLLGTLLSGISVVVLARAASRHIGPHAVLPVTLFAIVYLNFSAAVFGGFQLETIQLFFAVLGALAALEALTGDNPWDAFIVGLCAAVASMLKPTGLAVAGAFAVALIFSGRGARRTLVHLSMMLLGVSIPIAAVVLYLVQSDILRDMPQLARQISTYAANSAWGIVDAFKPPTVAVILGFPFLIRWRVFRHPRYRNDVNVDRRTLVFAVTWLVLELIGVLIQRRMYAYHFLVILAPAALLFGMLPRRTALKPLAAGLLPVVILSVVYATVVVLYRDPHRSLSAAGLYLREHAQPGDAVWQDEMMRLLIETDLRPASRIPMAFLFTNYDDAPLDYSRIMLDDFERTRPKYILLRTRLDERVAYLTGRIAELEQVTKRRENFVIAWHRIRQYVDQHYRPEATVGRETVYRRAD